MGRDGLSNFFLTHLARGRTVSGMKPERPVLFAPCTPELLVTAKSEARRRGQTVGGLIRKAVVSELGLPADYPSHPAENKTSQKKFKKKLARPAARG